MSNNIIQEGAATIVRLNKDNAEFSYKNGFVTAIISGEEYQRVFLHRTFPFDMPWEYISVTDPDHKELGIIYNIADFDDKSIELLKKELERKYYEPTIKSIIQVKERYGFSYWSVLIEDDKKINFTMQDTFRNIIRIGESKAILLDVDGNRFVIEDIEALDKKSHKKIELYI